MTKPFAGLKIADFSTAGVGPASARYFADQGALVVKVESATLLDAVRVSPPFKEGIFHPDRAPFFTNYNIGKYSITLDLSQDAGAAVARRLAGWADVMLECFGREALQRWGLEYETLSAANPSLIMASTSQMGQSGPYRRFKGFGNQGAAMAGFGTIVGYSLEEPRLPYAGHTDFIAHRHLILGILAALLHRRKTGRGQHVDHSQVESAIHHLGPALLDSSANGRAAQPVGNFDPHAVPHNAYRCKGEDRWCVIAVRSEEEWRAFCQAIGSPSWCVDPKFASFPARKQNEPELDTLVENWTIERTQVEVMQLLQAAGVAAGIVARAEDLHSDPQLRHREHFWLIDHPVIGPHTHDAPGYRLSANPPSPAGRAPLLGEHTRYVCCVILGMPEDEFDTLAAARAFQ